MLFVIDFICALHLSTLGRIFSRRHFEIFFNYFSYFFFFFSPGNRIRHFMQTVSNEDNMHEMSNPVYWEIKKKKYFKLSSVENFTQSANRLSDQSSVFIGDEQVKGLPATYHVVGLDRRIFVVSSFALPLQYINLAFSQLNWRLIDCSYQRYFPSYDFINHYFIPQHLGKSRGTYCFWAVFSFAGLFIRPFVRQTFHRDRILWNQDGK